ncbi:MAG TPA: hypothetical protein VJM32_02465 [Candidatus Saccharimonadales bacterium]|nr:hypothetical protein [Candidatus Saccharimonadales bacterium]
MRQRTTLYQCSYTQLLMHLGFGPGYIGSVNVRAGMQIQEFVDRTGQTMAIQNSRGARKMLVRIDRLRVIEDHPRGDYYPVRRGWIKKPERLTEVPWGLLIEGETLAYNTYDDPPHYPIDMPEMVELPEALTTRMLVLCTSMSYIHDTPMEHRDDLVPGVVQGVEVQFPTAIVRGPLADIMWRH